MTDQRFSYSKIAAESNWEPGGALQLEQKIEDSAKVRSVRIRATLRGGGELVQW